MFGEWTSSYFLKQLKRKKGEREERVYFRIFNHMHNQAFPLNEGDKEVPPWRQLYDGLALENIESA